MKGYERREAGAGASYRLASWDGRQMTWKEAKVSFGSEGEARKAARKPGRYRVSRVDEGDWSDVATFEV